jgi:SAM-dependent methyltransferase
MADRDLPKGDTAVAGPPWLADVLGPSRREEATLKDGVLRFVDSDSYAESFGREWNWFEVTQLDRPDEDQVESRRTFFQKTGFSPEELEGSRVLDVGCGMGRFAEVAAAHGAEVVGVDLSIAVEAANRNLGQLPNTAFIQADVFDLPLQPETFDLIYSIGVLHHTPDTRAAFAELPKLLKPGGRIAIWVYSGEQPLWYRSSDVYRRLTTKMDHGRLLRLCNAVAPLGRLYRTRFGKYLTPLLPVSSHPDPEWRVLDTFDWYAPKYQWKHGWREVEGWFRETGLKDIRRHDFPIAVSGRRA